MDTDTDTDRQQFNHFFYRKYDADGDAISTFHLTNKEILCLGHQNILIPTCGTIIYVVDIELQNLQYLWLVARDSKYL